MLGSENPEMLLTATFYLIRFNFGMRGGDEHKRLKINKFVEGFQNCPGSTVQRQQGRRKRTLCKKSRASVSLR